jgi:GTP-binding protein
MEGASQGRGLGISFLKHIKRCKTILYLIDSTSKDPEEEFKILQKEVKSYDPAILTKPKVVVLTKSDLVSRRIPIKLKKFILFLKKNTLFFYLILFTYLLNTGNPGILGDISI